VGAKRYEQWCGLAQALDRIGDRWSLLIVRELLLGPRRYTDLRDSLGSIATNLLADRLRDLEWDGIVRRREVPPPTPAITYELTERGQTLEEAVLALIRWGGQFLAAAPKGDAFRPGWLALALRAVLEPRSAKAPAAGLTVTVPEVDVWVRIGAGRVATGFGEAARTDLTVTGDPRLLLGLASGHLTLDAAEERGLRVAGSERSRRAFARMAA
jgi:DNA-binding HxlR family transcriptional regulator